MPLATCTPCLPEHHVYHTSASETYGIYGVPDVKKHIFPPSAVLLIRRYFQSGTAELFAIFYLPSYLLYEGRCMGMVIFNGEKLKSVRESLNKTQVELAEAADTTDRYVRSLESGEKKDPSDFWKFRWKN